VTPESFLDFIKGKAASMPSPSVYLHGVIQNLKRGHGPQFSKPDFQFVVLELEKELTNYVRKTS
jgi:hypothetical protein